MTELNPNVVIPIHCSGTYFIEAMRRRMPDQLVTTNVGTRFTFAMQNKQWVQTLNIDGSVQELNCFPLLTSRASATASQLVRRMHPLD